MKTLWICATLWLLSMAAPGWIPAARGSVAPAAAGAIEVAVAPPDYSGYLYLHATRHAGQAGPGGTRAGTCVE